MHFSRLKRGLGGRDADLTRDSLMYAGTAVFAEKGFAGARVEAIARRAGVNKAMISYHFGGKKGLYTAILGANLDSVRERLQGLRGALLTPEERLREFVSIFALMAEESPGLPAMLLRELISGGRNASKDLLPRFYEAFGVIEDSIKEGVELGSLRPVDPFLTQLGIVGSLLSFFATQPFRDRLEKKQIAPFTTPSSESFVTHMQELITRGLTARTDAGEASQH